VILELPTLPNREMVPVASIEPPLCSSMAEVVSAPVTEVKVEPSSH
jgi:hypothetical protein